MASARLLSFWQWLTSVSDMILWQWVSIEALVVSRWTIALFISSWRCNALSNRLMEVACDWKGVRLVSLSGIPGGGVAGMGCHIGHTHLLRPMWRWRWLLQVTWKCLSWWGPWVLVSWEKYAWRVWLAFWTWGLTRVLYFLHHARTSDSLTGTLCNRVWGRNWHWWP